MIYLSAYGLVTMKKKIQQFVIKNDELLEKSVLAEFQNLIEGLREFGMQLINNNIT